MSNRTFLLPKITILVALFEFGVYNTGDMDANYSAAKHEIERDYRDDTTVFLSEGCPPHFHHQVELLACERGAFDVTVNNHSFRLGAGEAAVSHCYDIHRYDRLSADAVGYCFIVSQRYLSGYLAATKGKALSSHVISRPDAAEIILNAAKTYQRHQTDGNQVLLSGLVNTALGTVLDCVPLIPLADAQDEKLDFVRELLTYVHEHYDENLTLDSLARRFGYSPNHFSHLFNLYLKTNLKDYLNELRVSRAAALLKEGEISVTDAALEAGFTSARTFYRCFSKAYGTAPHGFIEAQRKKSEK